MGKEDTGRLHRWRRCSTQGRLIGCRRTAGGEREDITKRGNKMVARATDDVRNISLCTLSLHSSLSFSLSPCLSQTSQLFTGGVSCHPPEAEDEAQARRRRETDAHNKKKGKVGPTNTRRGKRPTRVRSVRSVSTPLRPKAVKNATFIAYRNSIGIPLQHTHTRRKRKQKERDRRREKKNVFEYYVIHPPATFVSFPFVLLPYRWVSPGAWDGPRARLDRRRRRCQ